MALAWTIIILIATLRHVNSYSGAFSSQSDFPRISKIEKQSDKRDHCPSSCKCDNLNKNMIINCGYKKLSLFPPNLSQSVFHLNLVGNDLMKLTYNYSLNSLNLLNVSQNNILEIDFHWLKSLKSLKFLDLSNNKLFSSSVKFSEQNSLVHLDLSSNSLSFVTDEMFWQMNSLSFLNISHNSIQNVSQNAFDDLINIKILDISYNKLPDIQHEWLKNLKNLEILILKKNNIQLLRNVVFSALKNLQVLDLSENNIKPVGLVSFKGLFQLEFLNLSSNSISHFQVGVFRSLELLKILDLSQNPITSLDNILIHSKNLEFLYLRELEKFNELNSKSLLGTQKLNLLDLSGSKELSDISLNAFHNSKNLKSLDISNSNLTSLRSGIFNKLQNLETLKLNGNPWKCDCYMYWLLMWLGEHTNSHLFSPSDTFCNAPSNLRGQVLLDALDHSMICTNASIHHHTNLTKFKVGSPALLECKVQGNPLPSLTWITPQKEAFYWTSFSNLTKKSDMAIMSTEFPNDYGDNKGRFYVTSDGSLAIQNVERGDGGFYVCIASNPLSYDSVSIRLTLDYEYLVHIKIISVLVGTATSFSFLLLTLVAVLIKMILKHFNVRCPCRNGNASPRTQQIKKILESMEHYKKQQLDRLRDNYNGQVQKIKDNCMQQMERLRESYSSQSERLRDIKDYGTLQIDRIRENYYSQVQRVRDYSASQIIRLRENYLFQRNRIRKFSAHHLYKLRENYKVQQQHLNKILENLNIESCRNVCQRTDSIVFEPDITLENVLVPKICLQTLTKRTCDYDNSSQISAYFTPDEAGSEISGHESDEPDSFEHTCIRKPCEREVSIIIEKSEGSSIPERDLTEVEQSDLVEVPQYSTETIV